MATVRLLALRASERAKERDLAVASPPYPTEGKEEGGCPHLGRVFSGLVAIETDFVLLYRGPRHIRVLVPTSAPRAAGLCPRWVGVLTIFKVQSR